MLFSQGFGSRRQCRALILRGALRIDGQVHDDPGAYWASEPRASDTPNSDTKTFEVDGALWRYRAKAYLMLHKPAACECSRAPQHHTSVFSLLPPQMLERGVQCVGRLDQDTTGLLLLSDDGQFIHRLASPKRHVPKIYHAVVRHTLDEAQLAALQAGVLLHGETTPSRALAATMLDTHRLALTIDEGKYHQVKRMVAAAGNRVEALHRTAIGGLTLPASLAPGAWRWLETEELATLRDDSA
jgi:16S rRNA pseudouridine516 synthase